MPRTENKGLEIIQAGGGIVWRELDREQKIAIVHRKKYQDWSLPKGKLKQGESWLAGAIREVEEEIQSRVSLEKFAGCCCYPVDGIPKVVLFWEMNLIQEGEFVPNEEIDQLLWISAQEAVIKLSYNCERELIISCRLGIVN